MANYLGIDIGATSIRAVRVKAAYRRLAIEALAEVDRASWPTLAEALQSAAKEALAGGEALAVSFEGERTFFRRLSIPAAGQKQIAELIPFELEADLPFDLESAVYDHVVLRRGAEDDIPVLAAAARIEEVKERVDLVKEATRHEPERVAPGAFALAGLVQAIPALGTKEPVAVVDLAETRCDVLVLEGGEPMFGRTLSRGTVGLPQTAVALARELKQSLSAWRALGNAPVTKLFLAGIGSDAPGAEAFLESELALPVQKLPEPNVAPPEGTQAPSLVRFAKPLGLALSLLPRTRALNLRRGALSYEGGFGFLRDKIPVLVGLGLVIVASFVFATLAELWALGKERASLEASLSSLSGEVLGESTTDPQRAEDLIDKKTVVSDEDPLPHADAFDVMVQLSEAVTDEMKHDIEDLDVQRGHVIVHGIVPTIPDAQQIATQLKAYRCFQDVKIVKTNQEVGADRQKYTLEFDLKCEDKKDKTAEAAASASAAPGASAP